MFFLSSYDCIDFRFGSNLFSVFNEPHICTVFRGIFCRGSVRTSFEQVEARATYRSSFNAVFDCRFFSPRSLLTDHTGTGGHIRKTLFFRTLVLRSINILSLYFIYVEDFNLKFTKKVCLYVQNLGNFLNI